MVDAVSFQICLQIDPQSWVNYGKSRYAISLRGLCHWSQRRQQKSKYYCPQLYQSHVHPQRCRRDMTTDFQCFGHTDQNRTILLMRRERNMWRMWWFPVQQSQINACSVMWAALQPSSTHSSVVWRHVEVLGSPYGSPRQRAGEAQVVLDRGSQGQRLDYNTGEAYN